MQNSIHKYGTTISSDGWDNITWRPLLNVILIKRLGKSNIEANCEKGKNCCFFHMTTPCVNPMVIKKFQLLQNWQLKSIFSH
jgi:hypothetical protein